MKLNQPNINYLQLIMLIFFGFSISHVTASFSGIHMPLEQLYYESDFAQSYQVDEQGQESIELAVSAYREQLDSAENINITNVEKYLMEY